MTDTERDALYAQLSRDVDALMRDRKFSQRALARRANVTDQTVLNILKGRPSRLASVIKVLEALDATFKICPKDSAPSN